MSSFEEKLNKDSEKQQYKKDDTLEKLAKMGERKQKARSKIKRWFSGLWQVLPLIIVSLLSLLIIGLDAFIEGVWQWSNLAQPEFWYSYVNLQMAKWLMAVTFLIETLKRMRKSNVKYKGYLDSIQDLVNIDNNDDEFINKQVAIEKLIRKKYFLEAEVSTNLYKLKKKYKIMDLDIFLKPEHRNHLIDCFNNAETRKEKRLYKRLLKAYEKAHEYTQKLTLKWQQEHLKSYKVKYPPISRTALISGFKPQTKDGTFNIYKTKVVKTSLINIAPSTITATLFSMFIMVFDIVSKDFTIGALFTLFAKTLLIFWNTFTVVSLTFSIFESTYLRSAEERSHDLGIFHKRHKNDNKDEKHIIKILNDTTE